MAKAEKGGCRWECYGAPCREEFVNADGLCEKHASLRCGLCGGPSDLGCDHCGQLVCGNPVCAGCGSLCAAHGGVKRHAVPPALLGLGDELVLEIFGALGTNADKVRGAAEAVLLLLERRGLIPGGTGSELAARISRKAGAA